MFRLSPVLALCGAFFLMPTEVAARHGGGGGGFMETLSFVAETPVFRDGEAMALCTLATRQTIGPIPYMVEAEGYALAPNRCAADFYYEVNDTQVAAMIAAGQLPADTPLQPPLSTTDRLINYASIAGLVLFTLIAIGGALFKALGGGRKRRRVKGDPNVIEAALFAMCTVARADGTIDTQEANVVAAIATDILGYRPDTQQTIAMLYDAPDNIDQIDFRAFADGLKTHQKRAVMYAALRVAVADGQIDEAEHRAIQSFAQALDITGDVIRAMLADIRNPKHTRRAGVRNKNRYAHFEGRYSAADENENAGVFKAFGVAGTLIRSLRGVADDVL